MLQGNNGDLKVYFSFQPYIYLSYFTDSSWEDEGMGAVTNDAGLLTVGFSIVLVYVTFTIGNYSMIHHKVKFIAL